MVSRPWTCLVCKDNAKDSRFGQEKCYEQNDCPQDGTFCYTDYGACMCEKNYHYNLNTGKCEKIQFHQDKECIVATRFGKDSDYSGSVCDKGNCGCGRGYRADKHVVDNICLVTSITYETVCNSSDQCMKGWEACVDGKCQCSAKTR